MKVIVKTAVVALVLTAASASFAQDHSDASITRAQVRAELVQLEDAGYRPFVNDVHYPTNVQIAEANVTQQQAATQDKAPQAYGSDTAGNSQAGQSTKGSTGRLAVQKPSTPNTSRSAGHFDEIYFGS